MTNPDFLALLSAVESDDSALPVLADLLEERSDPRASGLRLAALLPRPKDTGMGSHGWLWDDDGQHVLPQPILDALALEAERQRLHEPRSLGAHVSVFRDYSCPPFRILAVGFDYWSGGAITTADGKPHGRTLAFLTLASALRGTSLTALITILEKHLDGNAASWPLRMSLALAYEQSSDIARATYHRWAVAYSFRPFFRRQPESLGWLVHRTSNPVPGGHPSAALPASVCAYFPNPASTEWVFATRAYAERTVRKACEQAGYPACSSEKPNH